MGALRRTAVAGALALGLAVLAVPAPAQADEGCANPPSARSFAWALDPNLYFPMPHGGFEDGAGWDLDGSARISSGVNQTVMPASPTDAHALTLPAGAAASADPLCVEGTATVMRFFARSRGLAGIAVVKVTARDEHGATQTLLSPALPLTPAWSAPLLLFRLPLLGDGLTSVTVTIRSIGLAAIDVDDVYVDPLRQR